MPDISPRIISRAEAFETVFEAFQQVNFNAFDFDSIKESLIDYIKVFFPEDFNDFIESSEFIALLEIFAYIGAQNAYRLDINAHENFLVTAERKESVLRLAKLLSYKATRNLPARGLVKFTSVSTTEQVFDSQGQELTNRTIIWNDPNNPDWKEQFILIMNRILEQDFGTVEPSERVQVDDVLFELYTMNNTSITTNGKSVLSYSTTVQNEGFPMELVPIELTSFGPTERRPEINAKFSILFGNDGLGDASDTTGFFSFTKQGTLAFNTLTFDGITPNLTSDVTTNNINDTDVYLNQIDSNTLEILTEDPDAGLLAPILNKDGRFGEWIQVDLANAQNIIFNTNENRQKYEVETLDDDQIRLIFGDGEFSEIPSGTFHVWFRTSANRDFVIPRTAIIDQSSSLTYLDVTGSVQTFTFAFSLVNSLQNASSSEDIEHIRRVAPGVYFTQDRMVNGRDYNTFMLQDPSILKLRAVNRTFAGDSRYIPWHDPSDTYENVKVFGDDLALYFNSKLPQEGLLQVVNFPATPTQLLTDFIEPLLSSSDFFMIQAPIFERLGLSPGNIRRTFNTDPYEFCTICGTDEVTAITAALGVPGVSTVDLFYSVLYDEWTVDQYPCDTFLFPFCTLGLSNSLFMIRIEARYSGSDLAGWDIRSATRRLVAQSEDSLFFNTNDNNQIVDFDSLDSTTDQIVVLQANTNPDENGILTANQNFDVLGMELIEQNLPLAGLPDVHKLNILPIDQNDDGIPDNVSLENILNYERTEEYQDYTVGDDGSDSRTLPDGRTYLAGHEVEDLRVFQSTDGGTTFSLLEFGVEWNAGSQSIDFIRTHVVFASEPAPTDLIRFESIDFVYFNRASASDRWIPAPSTDEVKTLFILDEEGAGTPDDRRFKREEGRDDLNFAWFHFTPRLNLVDPAASNIIDIFIITIGFETAMRQFLDGRVDIQPVPPAPLDLRIAYADLLENKMISDTTILHSGKFKILFGARANPELRAKIKVIRPADPTQKRLTDNEVKVRVVDMVKRFLDTDFWQFGETFFFSELSAAIHIELGLEIDSVVLVPTFAANQFGDLYVVQSREDEIFIADISTGDVEIVTSYTPENIRQNPDEII